MSQFTKICNFFSNAASSKTRKRKHAAAGLSVAGLHRSAESLERRDLMSVSQIFFSGSILVVRTDNYATNLSFNNGSTSTTYQLRDNVSGQTWNFNRSAVGTIEFQGGAGNDRFVDNVANLKMRAFGFGGDDYLEGYNGNDEMVGGDGNDILKGYGGNDNLFGGAGDDVLLGMDGDDQLVGDIGNDQLNGGAGYDRMWGQGGDDVIVAIDNGTSDYVEGGTGRNTMWIDQSGWYSDYVYGATSSDKIHYVSSFANGADKTLNGDSIADPTLKSGAVYRNYYGYSLFSSYGPRMNDVYQGNLGDCYFLAGLGAIANDSPFVLRQNMVDFNDGTFGVRLGNKFYRVDADLAVYSSNTAALAYAKLGAQNSLWVAIAEKAFAFYRTGANSYASIEGGWGVEANLAFGSTSAGQKDIQSYNATTLANDLAARWNGYQSVTIGFLYLKSGGIDSGKLIMSHMYTLVSINRNSAGQVVSFVLRNPWGVDGIGNDGNNDGLVTVTAAQLMQYVGRVNWGYV